ncbi:MAG: hypothetical protein Q4E33_01610 [Erysipelotrichaceae bacterium]|nr:hypothetical protein [Erysipelotrichaceae bacterium]
MSKIDETIQKMQESIDDLENTVKQKTDRLNETAKERTAVLVEKTETAINSSIEKIKAVAEDVKDEEKLNEFLENVQVKSKEAVDYTKAKVEEFANTPPKQTVDKVYEDIAAEFDKIKDSDVVKSVGEFFKGVSDNVTEYLNKPEVKEAINKAKKTTISIAEKGVDGLKKVLATDEVKEAKEKVEDVVEAAADKVENVVEEVKDKVEDIVEEIKEEHIN